ncbi:hypothetical protein AAFC00_003387 [Neodothiora populina]|uniref:Uncharacterized protein n=1 Tax=Neodothiora populina TaxID=2781224 RepID=A0ABR3PE92_9PEZI
MVYLTYIIDYYDFLQNVTIFMHAERYQWHNDDPDYDGQRMLSRMNISHVRAQGYTSLRCAWNIGCPIEVRPENDLGTIHHPPKAGQIYKPSFEELFPETDVPGIVGSPCCAQFAVSKEAIRSRPRSDYERYRQWILKTDQADELSGRFLEYAWHSSYPL